MNRLTRRTKNGRLESVKDSRKYDIVNYKQKLAALRRRGFMDLSWCLPAANLELVYHAGVMITQRVTNPVHESS